MKITIGHLYYDLLNLYGESGNILALKSALESHKIEVDIKNLSINDDIDFKSLDFVYIGMGTEENQIIALKHLMNYKDDINQMIMNNKLFLVTGNSIELFGKSIQDKDLNIETLGVFDYTTIRTLKRIVSECIFNFSEFDEKILGFQNHSGEIQSITTPFFTVEKGFGSIKNSKAEGIIYNNFYGTYLIGPILARNPMLLEYICKKLIINIDPTFEIKDFNLDLEKIAHDKYLYIEK